MVKFGKPSVSEMIVYGATTTGLVFNCLVIDSCELLQYPGGSLGLFKFSGNGAGHGCAEYSGEVEDPAIKYAQMWSLLALVFGCSFLVLVSVLQQRAYQFPYLSDSILLNLFSIGIQISMAHVFIAWKNDICETYGCGWGRGALYNVAAQGLHLTASIMVVFQRGGVLPSGVDGRASKGANTKKGEIAEPEPFPLSDLVAESSHQTNTQLRERKICADIILGADSTALGSEN